jgi:hypothetical protein
MTTAHDPIHLWGSLPRWRSSPRWAPHFTACAHYLRARAEHQRNRPWQAPDLPGRGAVTGNLGLGN